MQVKEHALRVDRVIFDTDTCIVCAFIYALIKIYFNLMFHFFLSTTVTGKLVKHFKGRLQVKHNVVVNTLLLWSFCLQF